MHLKKTILLITVTAVLGGAAYYFYTNREPEKIKLSTLTEPAAAAVVNIDSLRFDKLVPSAVGYVNDFGYYFTAQQADTLSQIIQQHQKATTNQIAIVTFNTLAIEPQDFDAFTKALANKWGVGQKEKNNGVTIVLCKELRKIRIQNGDGITPKLSDAATKVIIDKIIFPEFIKGDYYNGIKKGLLEITKVLQ
jgi:uncharacterized protein